MTVQIKYKSTISKNMAGNHVLFVDENFNISGIKNYISKNEYFHLSDLLKSREKKKNFLSFQISSKKTIFLVSIKKNINFSNLEKLGADFYNQITQFKEESYLVFLDTIDNSNKNLIGHFLQI